MSGSRVDVAIVGGGIAGVCLAYFVAESGPSDVVVFEREVLAGGCTGGSLGGVRQQFSTPEQVELAVRGRHFWKGFADRFDCVFDYHEDGYLMVTARDETHRRLRAAAEVQRDRGADDVWELAPDEISDLLPWLNVDGLRGGVWTPEDGRINPTDGVYVLASAARRAGASFREGVRVTSIEPAGASWLLSTSEGPIGAGAVVVACGLGSPALLRPFGLELPIAPMPIHYAFTTPVLTGERFPLVLDLDSGLCVEREQDGAMVTILESSYAGTAEDMLVQFAQVAAVRAPIFTHVGIRTTMTAAADATGGDGHPFIGEVEPGLWAMTGFDAHGTMQAPAIAEFTANLVAGRPDSFLCPETFAPRRTPSSRQEWFRAAKR